MSEQKPVAWTSAAQLKRMAEQPSHNHRMWGEPLPYHDDIPLYHASAITSLMEENERLKQRLSEVAHQREDGKWIALTHGLDRDAAEARARAAEQRVKDAVGIVKWFVENDETNEGDTPMPERGGRTWDEINAYWIEGLNRGRRFIKEAGE